MTDLGEMRRQRQDLDRKIREAELAARAAWNDGLTTLTDAVERYASAAGIEVSERTRKNVVIMDLGGLVTVQLGYEEPYYSRVLDVTAASGVSASFGTGVQPSAAVVIALVRELLLAQVPAS